MRKFSIVIPVYNRPQELEELLATLVSQTYSNFEVIVVDDGSEKTSEHIVKKYRKSLKIKYYFKENSGQGFSRNFGFEKATGDYFIVLDSDVLVPENYLVAVNNAIESEGLDAFGGPDREHPSFSPIQKAINYSMTSVFTTGGIRGGKKRYAPFHPRSFNMGFSRDVYNQCFGFIITRMAEDLELSIRIIEAGFKVGFVPEAYVYHKRRSNFKQFFKQLFFFGRGRINILRFYPHQLKLLHAMPSVFVLALLVMFLFLFIDVIWSLVIFLLFLAYFLLIFSDSMKRVKDKKLASLCVAASFIQLSAYGMGFFTELFNYLVKRKET
jgi:glycosyltransferase involved in cell wall biosynthesis